MRIGILAKGGTGWIGGLHYTCNLIRALRTLPETDQPTIYLLIPEGTDSGLFKEIGDLAETCILPQAATVADRQTGRSESAGEQPVSNPPLARLLAERHIDCIYPCMRSLGSQFPTPWLPWVPDLQHRHYPDYFSAGERNKRDREFNRMASDAPLVVLSSESARNDFDRYYPGHRSNLRVLHFTTVAEPEWFCREGQPCNDPPIGRRPLPDRFVMLPNQFWVHKNHRVAFEAVRTLARRGLDMHLVCTGKTEDPRHPGHVEQLRDFLHTHGLVDRIHILGLLPRAEQIQLMRRAVAIVQPSLFEGWSTVVEDARALGKHIVLSDIPVHREQNPCRAVYFDPGNSEELADAVEKIWNTRPKTPCAADAEQARAEHTERVRQYARTFLTITQELRSLYVGGPAGLNPRSATIAAR